MAHIWRGWRGTRRLFCSEMVGLFWIFVGAMPAYVKRLKGTELCFVKNQPHWYMPAEIAAMCCLDAELTEIVDA